MCFIQSTSSAELELHTIKCINTKSSHWKIIYKMLPLWISDVLLMAISVWLEVDIFSKLVRYFLTADILRTVLERVGRTGKVSKALFAYPWAGNKTIFSLYLNSLLEHEINCFQPVVKYKCLMNDWLLNLPFFSQGIDVEWAKYPFTMGPSLSSARRANTATCSWPRSVPTGCSA